MACIPNPRSRGVAMLMVLVVLAMLVLIAIPFSNSMRVGKVASGNALSKTKAKLIASGAFDYSVAQLTKTCQTQERDAQQPALFKTPDYDFPEEYRIEFNLPGIRKEEAESQMWSAWVEDEQGKIDVNSATPWLLGNLMGSALVTKTAESYDATLVVDTTRHFPPEKGYLWIDGELIFYERAEKDRFTKCRRGMHRDSPRFLPPQIIRAGSLVIDPKAHRVCTHRILVRPGHFTPYRTIEETRQIADLGAYAIASRSFASIGPFLTVHARRNVGHGWIRLTTIQNDLPGFNLNEPDIVSLSDTCTLRPGMTVCIEENQERAYAMVLSVGPGRIVLDNRMEKRFNKGKAIVSVLEPHPININSAHPRIIHASLKGMRAGNEWIDERQADIISRAIYGHRMESGGFKSLEHLKSFLFELKASFEKAGLKDEKEGEPLAVSEIHAILSAAKGLAGDRNRFTGVPSAMPVSSEYIVPAPPLASFIFHNHDTYTIEATGILHNPSRVPLAQHTIKKIVTVAPNDPQKWRIEKQRDFEYYLSSLPSYRVITWPNLLRDFTIFPLAEVDPSQVGLSLDTVPLCPKTPQGAMYGQYFPWNETYEGIECPGKAAPSLNFLKSGLEIAPGAVSFWFHPQKTGGDFSIFDMGEREWENRIHLTWSQNQLTFRVADASLEQKASEIQADLPLRPQWHHILAAWYSTSPGCLGLWMDGRPVGQFGYRHGKTLQRAFLARALKADDHEIPLTDAQGFPAVGVAQIGDEAIEYESIRGNSLMVREKYEGFEMDRLARGARGTQAREHPKGAAVHPFGYSDTLASKVFKSTVLTYDLAEEGLFTKLAVALKKTDKSIEVKNVKRFQQSGFLLIAWVKGNQVTREIVKYFGTSGNRFLNCVRGQIETASLDFEPEAYVFPISMMVKDCDEYEENGIVQVGNEWIAYEKKVDRVFFVFNLLDFNILQCQKTGKFNPPYRRLHGTASATHAYGEKVFPVFKTRPGWAGRFDRVTLIDGTSGRKEEGVVNWAFGPYVAFMEDVEKTVLPKDASRMLKFPSGELPSTVSPCLWGQSMGKPSSPFLLDELHLVQARSRLGYRTEKAILSNSDELPINTTIGLPEDGGLLKIGDEYVGYADSAEVLNGVKRGALSTPKNAHASGSAIFPFFPLPCSSLARSIDPRSSALEIKSAFDFPGEGNVRCGEEIIGYSDKSSIALAMPSDEQGNGLLRGAFGTSPRAHSKDELVYYFPVRYWDRTLWGHDGPRCAFFSASKTAPGAFWKRVTWTEENPSESHLGIHVKARLDGKPSWETPPTNRKGGIFQFDRPEHENRLHLQADTLEIRVYFSYQKNAYASGFWKEKAVVKSILAEYLQPVCVWENAPR